MCYDIYDDCQMTITQMIDMFRGEVVGGDILANSS